MKRYGYWLIAGLLCWGTVAQAQEQKSEDYVQTVTALLQEKTGKAPQPQEIADALSNRLLEIYQKGDYQTGLVIAEQAYRFAEQKLGPEHPATLDSINNLALQYQTQARYGEAEPLYRRALAGYEKALGPEHPDTLNSANNLANLYHDKGRYGEAEPLLLRALAGYEKVFGLENPKTLLVVNNLASLYQAQERYGEAEPLYKRALSGNEKMLGLKHPQTLISINNLAGLYQIQGHYWLAEMFYRRVLLAREKALGPEHHKTILIVSNLALLYKLQGRYEIAEPLYQRVLATRKKVLGSEHPDTLGSLINLAALYHAQGRYEEAKTIYQRALAGYENVLGPEHPNTLMVQLNYTATLVNLKQPKRALQMLERMEPRLLEHAALQLRHTRQESVRRLFLTTQSDFQDVVLTLALSHPEPEYLALAAKVMLRWKQIQGEEEAFLARLVRRRSEKDAEIRELAKQIADLRRDLSHLANLPEPNTDLLRKKLNELEAKEIRLAQISREFNRHLQVRGANADDVRHALPREGGALLELRLYEPVDFKTGKRGEPHWAALLLPAAGEVSLHDLGPVAATQNLARKLRATHARAAAAAAALYKNLFGTLDDKLKRYNPLYIAPDGFLSLLAFAELVTPDGCYWIQRQTLRQVSTGRHLIAAYDQDLDKPKGLLALGGVDYEGFGVAKEPAPQPPKPADQNLTVALRAMSNEIGQFKALAETGKEAEEVKNAYWSYWNIPSQVWLGADASASRLKTLATPPRVLHLATHGFYLSEKSNIVDRPMVLSGLALAGANQGLQGKAGPDGEDGILYALEVQDLNLEDTELVTLSACDTGKGTLDYSEGVYGLVRAFRTAGARNVLMSLWPLGDRSAREFMARFYRTWLNGPKPKDLAVALRETQLFFIQNEDESLRDPRVWAPFVLIEGRGL